MSREGDAAEAVARLDQITRRLRRECPWDREQDERSIVSHTVEAAYELADAATQGDDAKLLDELGDVLFQVHFLALLLEERDAGSLAEVAETITEKLVRRHPHVFGERSVAAGTVGEAGSSGQVLANWDRIKREVEGRGADDPFADVPENLPGPLYARKLLRRGASAGIAGPAPDARVALARASAAIGSLEARARGATASPDAPPGDRDDVERELGEALLALVDAARILRADPELALRAAADRLRDPSA